MDCLELCLSLPSTDDGVDVEWIKLESVASAPAVLGSDHGSPRAQKWVKDTISSGTAILDGINDQGDGLWGGVESEKISYLELTTIPPINVQCGGGLQLPFANPLLRWFFVCTLRFFVTGVTAKCACSSKFTKFITHHIFSDINRNMQPAIMYCNC